MGKKLKCNSAFSMIVLPFIFFLVDKSEYELQANKDIFLEMPNMSMFWHVNMT